MSKKTFIIKFVKNSSFGFRRKLHSENGWRHMWLETVQPERVANSVNTHLTSYQQQSGVGNSVTDPINVYLDYTRRHYLLRDPTLVTSFLLHETNQASSIGSNGGGIYCTATAGPSNVKRMRFS